MRDVSRGIEDKYQLGVILLYFLKAFDKVPDARLILKSPTTRDRPQAWMDGVHAHGRLNGSSDLQRQWSEAKDETSFRYAHIEIRTRVVVICDPNTLLLDQRGAPILERKTSKSYHQRWIFKYQRRRVSMTPRNDTGVTAVLTLYQSPSSRHYLKRLTGRGLLYSFSNDRELHWLSPSARRPQHSTTLGKYMANGIPPTKCQILRGTMKRNAIQYDYSIHDQTLKPPDSVKHLGVERNNKQSWQKHIHSIPRKADAASAFLQRNMRTSD